MLSRKRAFARTGHTDKHDEGKFRDCELHLAQNTPGIRLRESKSLIPPCISSLCIWGNWLACARLSGPRALSIGITCAPRESQPESGNGNLQSSIPLGVANNTG